MKLDSILQNTKSPKAGIIPFIRTEKGIEMLFMVPSDPLYGGDSPQIAKGGIDKGENPTKAAIREGQEELGLKLSNCLHKPELILQSTVSGMDATYDFLVFGVEVHSKEKFGSPHYETAKIVWLTLDEFKSEGRKSHIKFAEALVKKMTPKTKTSDNFELDFIEHKDKK